MFVVGLVVILRLRMRMVDMMRTVERMVTVYVEENSRKHLGGNGYNEN